MWRTIRAVDWSHKVCHVQIYWGRYTHLDWAKQSTVQSGNTNQSTPIKLSNRWCWATNTYTINIPVPANQSVAEEKTWRIEKLDQHKRTKYLMNCENSLWRRWQREHLTALKEWHNLTHKAAKRQPNVAYVVIIKTKSKNCRSWPPAIVNKTYLAKDGIIHAVQLKTANGMLERPVQHLYPLELNSNQAWETQAGTPTADLNSNALVFRLRRDAAVAARAQIQHLAEDEQWITIPFLLNLKIVNLI